MTETPASPATSLLRIFKQSNCTGLRVHGHVNLTRSRLAKVQGCFEGRKKRKLPYVFSELYPGQGKEGLGAYAILQRSRNEAFLLDIQWFPTSTDQLQPSGRFGTFVGCISELAGETEVVVSARFEYDRKEMSSLFKPIQLIESAKGSTTAFDEIIGFTAVKRDSQGKVLYELEVSFTDEKLLHDVGFSQKVKLAMDSLPQSLVEGAKKISTLALEPEKIRI